MAMVHPAYCKKKMAKMKMAVVYHAHCEKKKNGEKTENPVCTIEQIRMGKEFQNGTHIDFV